MIWGTELLCFRDESEITYVGSYTEIATHRIHITNCYLAIKRVAHGNSVKTQKEIFL